MDFLTVSQLNDYVKLFLESNPKLKNIYLMGEVSGVTYHPSGHIYFTLKDDTDTIKAVMFRSYAGRLRFRIENGMRILCMGNITLYKAGGSYQINVTEVQPDGIGALSIAFEQLKHKLELEGLFDSSRKKQIPYLPNRIGVITAPQGAAVRDILNILKRRCALSEVVFYPSLVQGPGAANQLIQAIQLMNNAKKIDVIIIGRGGGSIEDLWAFNDEGLARAIAESNIPIISAVGHETDFTICDFVSDLRAPTPSAAAELAVPDCEQILETLNTMEHRVLMSVTNMIDRYRNKLEYYTSKDCLKDPENYIDVQLMRLDLLTQKFSNISERILEDSNHKFISLVSKLDMLSPLKVLGRGYAIPQMNGKIIKSIYDVEIGDIVQLKVSDGELSCEIKEI